MIELDQETKIILASSALSFFAGLLIGYSIWWTLGMPLILLLAYLILKGYDVTFTFEEDLKKYTILSLVIGASMSAIYASFLEYSKMTSLNTTVYRKTFVNINGTLFRVAYVADKNATYSDIVNATKNCLYNGTVSNGVHQVYITLAEKDAAGYPIVCEDKQYKEMNLHGTTILGSFIIHGLLLALSIILML